ncbi:MAG: GNAT family N-acetyltransferase [Comamonas sp.]|nr:GNAT family N-acetyltransferase [Comamonas sp.]
MKMNKPFVSLCPEITRDHALSLVDWLNDEDVVRHLSDSRHVSRHIEQLIDRIRLPILTHLFNQGGRFFMVYDRKDLPVGFVRLIRNGQDCEIVLVIGQRDRWGRKLGVSALHEGMKRAFFDLRAERLIARIHAGNTRSLKAFAHNGFVLEHETPALKCYAMTAQRYLQRLRAGASGAAAGICITAEDQARLRDRLALEWESQAADLEHEVERAMVVDARQMQGDVVTMNSRALLRLDEQSVEVALVYPEDADDDTASLSVFSGLGTAILGCREGDHIVWRILDRTRHIRIEKVLYQPEAAGHFHL